MRDWCSENNGLLIIQWECQWPEKPVRYLPTYQFPRILRPFEDRKSKHISNLILNDELFGFVECDISSPEWLIEKYGHLNFPPVIQRQHVTVDMIGDFMKDRLEALGRKIPPKGLETIVNGWHGKKLLLFTPLLRWYLELGLVVSEVYCIIQYQPSKCFEKFINACVAGRIQATSDVNDLQAQSFKICMNSR